MTTDWADVDRMTYVRTAPRAVPPIRWEPVKFRFAQGGARMCLLDSGLSLFHARQVTLGPKTTYIDAMGVILPDSHLLRLEVRPKGGAELQPFEMGRLSEDVMDAIRQMHKEGVKACSALRY